MEIEAQYDEDVAFYAEGYSEEVNQRAEDCAHKVFRRTLHDVESGEWRKECLFCPAVLEQTFTEGSST